eukprot:CAMPEP_0177586062 /NCGR_PEP_ID=MMETSP0419_2-20121207/4860_1 /TAXON_ID=582737 /ORGANISM="Tetraselmis sp., Strain GSL018" /LENGTH=287 /DNA_ID=CAMNT_0019075905 /DNA_START=692 /DNA_END=1555 /DNA_ORIENTATION=-
MAIKFLRDLSTEDDLSVSLKSGGTALMFIEDNGTLPLKTLLQLRDIKVPLLSHAIRGREEAEVAILIPDFHFIQHEGFSSLENFFKSQHKSIKSKLPQVFWRGSTTGIHGSVVGTFSGRRNESVCYSLPRVVACLVGKGTSWLDLGISQVVQYCANALDAGTLQQLNLLKAPVEERKWSSYRGILEIDGNVNAWGNKWRLMTGSVLFKVESDYFNSYVIKEKPYKHFIPVKADLSDLLHKTQIVTTNKSLEILKLQRIAKAATQLGERFTYKSEIGRVAKELNLMWA